MNLNIIKSDLIFTRYLYIKDEVRLALLVSILCKSDDAIFWAYELYYSGFKHEFFTLIWKIYYDFFATLNPTFETYLLKKHKEWIQTNGENDPTQDILISSIIQSLLFRPFNSDVFLLRNICESFEIEINYNNDTEIITDMRPHLEKWIEENDYRSIAQWILNGNHKTINMEDIYIICLNIFEEKGVKLTKIKLAKEFVSVLKNVNILNMNGNLILLSKIMCLFSKKAEIKKGRSIYIHVEPQDIIPYETIYKTDQLKHYKILEKAYMCGIDDLKHLSLFQLKRHKYNIQERYWYKWEYHASFSPIWCQRILQFGGFPDYTNETIVFQEDPDDESMQQFYDRYGLEPDEQKKEVQEKSIMNIEKVHDWKWFNKQYKKNGLFEVYEEELEEFDISGLSAY